MNEYFGSYILVCSSLLLKLYTPAQRENNANILSVAPTSKMWQLYFPTE